MMVFFFSGMNFFYFLRINKKLLDNSLQDKVDVHCCCCI